MNDDNIQISLDDLIKEHNTEKEIFDIPEQDDVKMPGRQEGINYTEKRDEITRESANQVGKQIADLVTNGTESLCAFIGKEKNNKYNISTNQKNDLAKVYADVALHYGFGTTNPLFTAIFLTIIIISVPIKTAFQDRKIKKLQDEQEEQRKELEIQAEKIKILEMKQKETELNNNNVEL